MTTDPAQIVVDRPGWEKEPFEDGDDWYRWKLIGTGGVINIYREPDPGREIPDRIVAARYTGSGILELNYFEPSAVNLEAALVWVENKPDGN